MCSSGIISCAASVIPWIIGGLALLVLVLAGLRLAFFVRERIAARNVEPREAAPPPPPVKPGTPIAPPPGQAPAPAAESKPQKPTPIQLRVADAPDLRLADFSDGQTQGDFGELLTAASLAAQGWKGLPSKMQGGRGIDGLFVREVRGGGGFECLAVETKTNSQDYNPASMTDAKLEADLARLYEGGSLTKHTADELIRALRQGPSFFRKELWRHDLSSGLTAVTELGRKGEKHRSVTRSNARLMSALFTALEQLDRRSVYVGVKPVDDEPISD